MNALQIVQEACGILGQPVPNSIQGSSDAGVRQFLGLLNNEGRSLSERYTWQVLIKEATFVTLAQEDQGALTTIIGVSDAYRFIINETMFNRDRHEPVIGPNSSMEWQIRKAFNLTGPFTEYRIRGNRLLFNSAPAAGEHIYFEFASKNWATTADGLTLKRAITFDTDEFLLDDELLLAGIEWRWRKAKGLDYAEDFNTYERKVTNATTRDATKPRVSLADRVMSERRIAVSPGSWPLS
jgi:hypothetical protein